MERDHQTPENTPLPEPLPVNFDRIPERLRHFHQWVVWNYAVVDDEIKKPPFDPKTGRRASVSRPETWGSLSDVQAAYEIGQFAGVGIVLTADMGIVGFDLDHCSEAEQTSDEARQIISALDSYAEASPSGSGVRILLEGKLPGALRRRGTIEMYEDMRYLTLTGQWIATTPMDIQPRQRELDQLYHRLFQFDSRETVQENTGGGCWATPTH